MNSATSTRTEDFTAVLNVPASADTVSELAGTFRTAVKSSVRVLVALFIPVSSRLYKLLLVQVNACNGRQGSVACQEDAGYLPPSPVATIPAAGCHPRQLTGGRCWALA